MHNGRHSRCRCTRTNVTGLTLLNQEATIAKQTTIFLLFREMMPIHTMGF
ncbi:hypothetical protein CSC32_1177 [Pseudomonas aeruginosa]|nr:hypothetical protein CSC32_1177 [Pseudomonas aeruginosa]RCG88338.1 hypothetical protein CSB86_3491 [Pseudomonas aeruginosa]